MYYVYDVGFSHFQFVPFLELLIMLLEFGLKPLPLGLEVLPLLGQCSALGFEASHPVLIVLFISLTILALHSVQLEIQTIHLVLDDSNFMVRYVDLGT